jgi:pimeloyl-ACP methyl ester carboxylesterase
MKQNELVAVLLLLLHGLAGPMQAQGLRVQEDSLQLYDSARQRLVPVTLYLPASSQKNALHPWVIFSHGYAANQPGASRQYSSINRALAAKGYWVASIQHELSSDDLMPATGEIQVVRKPFWERGAANILFVLHELKKRYPSQNLQQVLVMGHSNGGDISALFAQKNPERVYKLITLDNRRFPLPRTRQPIVCSIRSGDQPADDKVLPSPEEQSAYSMRIVYLKNILHNDMGDRANKKQRQKINRLIGSFLR